MPWWSWVLIWSGLVLVLLGVLGLIAWSLAKKLLALQGELAHLSELLIELEARAEQLVTVSEPARPAIVRGREAVAAERRSLRRRLDIRRDARRAARIERGRMLTTADPMAYAYLAQRK